MRENTSGKENPRYIVAKILGEYFRIFVDDYEISSIQAPATYLGHTILLSYLADTVHTIAIILSCRQPGWKS